MKAVEAGPQLKKNIRSTQADGSALLTTDCTWYLCTGVTKQQLVLRQAWAHMTEGESLRHGLEPSDVALYKAFPMPRNFLHAMRLTTNLMYGNKPFTEDEGGKGHGAEYMYKMIESLRSSTNNDTGGREARETRHHRLIGHTTRQKRAKQKKRI